VDDIQQGNNKRNNVRITHDGKTATKAQWARHLGLSSVTFEARIRAGWSMDRIVSTPLQSHWPLPASAQAVFFAANSVREAIDAIDERRYHDLWCDRMCGGFECNCSYGDPA
jgi:hypothetical protein